MIYCCLENLEKNPEEQSRRRYRIYEHSLLLEARISFPIESKIYH